MMIEVDNFDDVGLTYDLVRKSKVPITIIPANIRTIICTHSICVIHRAG